MNHEFHEECGVFGMYDDNAAGDQCAASAYLSLYALQHRGQESCGICVVNKGVMKLHKSLGLVSDVFTPDIIESLGTGKRAVGHVRYSTTGGSKKEDNAQPMLIHHKDGSMALAHNGNLTNANELHRDIEATGNVFHTSSDTEVIAYTIVRSRMHCKSIEGAVDDAMRHLRGAYSILLMSPRKLIAARDPHGFRPLCMGKLGSAVVFASESCAFNAIGATFVRDVRPGEIIVVSPGDSGSNPNVTSITTHCFDAAGQARKSRMCVFEYVYIARPDSVIEGQSVHMARKRAGALLAKAHPVEADLVIGNPDSGLDAALGYAEESGIPYGVGVVKNRYVGRTFIQPSQKERTDSIQVKLTPLSATVKGKRIVLVDDSMVRGNTQRHIVSLLRSAGATEIHVRISSPPFVHPCYFGIDVDRSDKLIAAAHSANGVCDTDGICREIGANSLGYLSVADVKRVADVPNADWCVGCFTGNYPSEPPRDDSKLKFETPLSNEID